MTDTNRNNADNVAFGAPMASGAVYMAAKGTALPTTLEALANFSCVGYIDENGVTKSTNNSSTTKKAWGQVTLAVLNDEYSEVLKFTMLEKNQASAELRYGDGATETVNQRLRVKHRPKGFLTERVIVIVTIDGIADNGAELYTLHRYPKAMLSALGDTTYVDNDWASYPAELTGLAGGFAEDADMVSDEYPVTGTAPSQSSGSGTGD